MRGINTVEVWLFGVRVFVTALEGYRAASSRRGAIGVHIAGAGWFRCRRWFATALYRHFRALLF